MICRVVRAPTITMVLLLLAGCAGISHRSVDGELHQAATAFLNAYGAGDKGAVLSLMSPDELHIYATDMGRVIVGRDAFARVFDAETKLWGGSAKFGALKNVSSVHSGSVGTLFFDAPLSIGDRPELIVRFATVWKRTHGGWKLVQSSAAVPAAE